MVLPNQWSGSPADLGDLVTIFRVEIENDSDQPFRIRYREFKLVGPGSFTNTAIPPYQVEGTVVNPVFLPQTYVYPRGFQFARIIALALRTQAGRGIPGIMMTIPPLQSVGIPAADRRHAGERDSGGVLEPEGRISGFLYFEKLPDNLDGITFEADLINARTGVTLGTVRIPFVIE